MRTRFFLFILAIFLLTVLTLGAAQYFIIRQESLRLVDQQIEEMLSSLYASKLSWKQIESVEEARTLVHDVLGDDRLNVVISIYGPTGNPIFQSHYADAAGMRLSVLSGRELLKTKRGHLIRAVTVPLLGGKQYLQAGVVLDDIVMRWRALGLRLVGYLVLVFILVSVVSFYLSQLLLRPIESLAKYLQHRVDRFDIVEELTPTWSHASLARWKSQDEVGRLIKATQSLLAKVRETVEVNRARAALLAHELKTPLTIIRNRLESLLARGDGASATLAAEAIAEVDGLARMVTAFTQWSLFCSDPAQSKTIHALKLSKVTRDLVQKLGEVQPGRLKFESEGEQTLFADPEHVKNAVSNLLSNALRYSPTTSAVEISLKNGCLRVRDYGPGFPPVVLERLGSPFNLGGTKGKEPGTGLGLAWVSAIARKYGWKFEIHSLDVGSCVELLFPLVSELE